MIPMVSADPDVWQPLDELSSRPTSSVTDEGLHVGVLGETDQVQLVVMVGQERFRTVPQAEKQADVARRSQHRADVQFVRVGGHSFSFLHECFPDPTALVRGAD